MLARPLKALKIWLKVRPVSECVRKAQCSTCLGRRNCDIHGSHTVRYDDEVYHSVTEWSLLECRGCETVFVQTVETNSEDYIQQYDPDNPGEIITAHQETLKYWPALSRRAKPDWMTGFNVPDNQQNDLGAAMAEVYGALNADLRMLAGIGIRTAYDIASERLGISVSLPFARKLEALVDTGRIGAIDKARLEVLVDAGSASAHRGWRPSLADLSIMMDVLEHFIFEAFHRSD